MRRLSNLAFGASLLTKAFGSGDEPQQAETVPTETPAIVPRDGEYYYMLQPPDYAQIPLNPPPPDRVKGSIGVWTEYLTEVDGSTSWIGPDPSYITVETTTTKNAEGADVTGTVAKAVDAVKNAQGGLDIMLSPAFRERVETILKEVPPCTKRRLRRRQAPSCGIEGAARRILEDEGVADLFSDQVHDEVLEEVGLDSDSGYGTDEDGFVEGAEGPPGSEAGETVETVILGSGEEAAAIAAAAAEVDGTITVGGITLTAVTFLGILMKAVDTNGKVEPAYQIPPEDIQTVTKTKSSTQTSTQTSTTSAASCATGLPDCPDDCKETSLPDPQPPEIVEWACSEGTTKGCKCNPQGEVIGHTFNLEFELAIVNAIAELEKPQQPEVTCPDTFSNAPSSFFGEVAAGFCESIKDSFNQTSENVPFDIYGKKIDRLAGRSVRLVRRAPPDNKDTFKDYIFWLSWIPKEGECLMNEDKICTEAFKKLVQSQPCGQNQGSTTNRMTVDAKIDVGCGEYKWHVEAPQDPLGGQNCHDRHKHQDVHDKSQDTWANVGCIGYAEKTMKPGDEYIYWHPPGLTGGAHMNYKISWRDGCRQFGEQSAQNPVEGVSCHSLMRANYKDCNNGGAGGFRDAGCLRYEFYVSY